MNKARSAILIGAGATVGILGGLSLWAGLPPQVDYSWIPADSAAIDDAYVAEMLRLGIPDDERWRKRGGGAHLEFVVPRSLKAKTYPVSFAQERLCTFGSDVVTPLLNVLTDPNTEPAVRELAALTLARFDDPRILPALADASRRNTLTARQLRRVLAEHLPFPGTIFDCGAEQIAAWLHRAEAVGYDELRLELLDELLRLRFEEGGLFPYTPDYRIVRWLNRFFDHDVDQWLGNNSPQALAFRDAQLRKGYDPIVAFSSLAGNVTYGGVGEGCRMVLKTPADQRACQKLIEAMYDPDSALFPKQVDGWLERLRAWYWAGRDSLVYDFDKHRFVVRERTKGTDE